MLTETELQTLLIRPEGISLEFKERLHALYHQQQEIRRQQKDELIKDILALANGNAASVGETSHLVFGASDTFDAQGKRQLFDVPDPVPAQQQILGWVNTAANPGLPDLQCSRVVVEGRSLFVISIPPSPYVHETRRALDTPQHYSPHVRFIREGQSIKIASTKEGDAKQRLKSLGATMSQCPTSVFGRCCRRICRRYYSQYTCRQIFNTRWMDTSSDCRNSRRRDCWCILWSALA